MSAVATDGHRIAIHSIDTPIQLEQRLQIIIPRKGVLELLRLLVNNDSPATVMINSNHIRVATSDFTFTSKLVDGRFPDYERVIPKGSNKLITIDRDLLKQALCRISILCNEKFKGVRFELRHHLLRISANNPEQEAAEEEINIDYTQSDLDIGFNVNYLIDILNIMGPGVVQLSFSDSNSSVLIEPGNSSEHSIFVVMPMRL